MSNNDLETNKISASILLAGVIAMLTAFITNILYNPDHEKFERGYKIAVTESNSAKKEVKEEKIDIIALMANADLARGKKLSSKCSACHSFEQGGKNKVGPNLWDIVGSKIASRPDYSYSKALNNGKNWDYNELYAFLNAPRKYAKGTKMSFAGLKKPKDVADMILYLRSYSDSPVKLP